MALIYDSANVLIVSYILYGRNVLSIKSLISSIGGKTLRNPEARECWIHFIWPVIATNYPTFRDSAMYGSSEVTPLCALHIMAD